MILAAGASRRMGRNKMLLEVEGEPVVCRSTRKALEAGLAPVVVITGHEADRIRAALQGLSCEFAHNAQYDGPTSGSLHAGLRALPASAESAVILLADMPFVTAAMLRSLVAARDITGAPLAVSRYGEVFAPPLLFSRSLFDELLAWHGEGCGKQVVLRHEAEAAIVDWPVEALQDLDTPEDAARIGAT